jgi:hypothetical protein
MEQFKRAKVIMLPTKNDSNIKLWDSNELSLNHQKKTFRTFIFQHLYIISDDKIKEGDWCLTGLKIVRQCNGFTYSQDGKTLNGYTFTDGTADTFSSCKRIIATTDTSLTTNSIFGIDSFDSSIFGGKSEIIKLPNLFKLPQPSKEFIEKYVECYNNGNIITEVLVEYEEWYSLQKYNGFEFVHKDWTKKDNIKGGIYDFNKTKQKLKVNPKNNTITIKTINPKGEHILKFVKDFINEFPNENLEYLQLRTESWIKQNL